MSVSVRWPLCQRYRSALIGVSWHCNWYLLCIHVYCTMIYCRINFWSWSWSHTVRDIVPYSRGCTAERTATMCFQTTGRLAVKAVACKLSAAFGMDRRAAWNLRYKLGLEHLGFYKPAVRSWNRPGDWQGASVVWPMLLLSDWIYVTWEPPEQYSSEFTEYDWIVYLGCRTTGYCKGQFCTSRRLG